LIPVVKKKDASMYLSAAMITTLVLTTTALLMLDAST
jgi:hypothetical protein